MRVAIWLLVFPAALAGQAEDAGAYRVELSVTYGPLQPTGDVQLDGTSVDFDSDLGLAARKANWMGRIVLKPGRRHHLIVEWAPYRFRGERTLDRAFTFQGRRYDVRETVGSRAELDYVFGGYQFDLVSRAAGYVGLIGGVVYGNAGVSATGSSSGVSATVAAEGTMPVAGANFRAYLLPGSRLLYADGELKGMSFGDRGHYAQFTATVGVALGRHVGILAGYAVTDAEVHNSDRIRFRFDGPVISLQVRDR